MAHAAQRKFFEDVRGMFPDAFTRVRALDCGSLDVNGSLRDLFTDSVYLGVDLRQGKNVDTVSLVHELPLPDASFDTVVSAEMLEHDQYWRASLRTMYRLVRPGGLLAFSCATTGRAEHGTRRHPDPEGEHEGLWGTSQDYYYPLTPTNVRSIFSDADFTAWGLLIEAEHCDLYCWGVKR